jgi:hypothetical protein
MPAITPDRRLASLTEAANPLAWVACIDFQAVCIPVIVLGNNGWFGDLSLLFSLGRSPIQYLIRSGIHNICHGCMQLTFPKSVLMIDEIYICTIAIL